MTVVVLHPSAAARPAAESWRFWVRPGPRPTPADEAWAHQCSALKAHLDRYYGGTPVGEWERLLLARPFVHLGRPYGAEGRRVVHTGDRLVVPLGHVREEDLR